MKTNGDKVTIREVYALVETKALHLENKVDRLEGKFDALEAGRLTRLETQVAEMQGKQFIVVGLISIILSALVGLVFKFIK